jgi:predicted nucleic acid-binding protein
VTLYLDTSSLVKLYVSETGSEDVAAQVRSATIVATSVLAYPEARAALARRRREGVLRPSDFTRAKASLESDWSKLLVIEATAALCHEAGAFAERYRLRAFDSVHLAAFAQVAVAAGVAETQFSSFDDALDRAAQSLRRSLSRKHR